MKKLSSILSRFRPARSILPVALALLVLGTPAYALDEEKEPTAAPEKLMWRNSFFTWENIFSAISLNRAAEPDWNPYYAQSFSFRPRFYIIDDLSLRARLDVEVELTTSDDTDHKREAILSDLTFDTVWAPSLLTIPKLDVKVTPSLRFVFPTSIESRGRSTVMVIGPGFTMRRDFQLMKGKWLNNLDLTYGFRVSKYLSRYANAQVADLGGCENINRPECQHQGRQNLSWRFANSLDAVLRVYDRLSVGVTVMFMNNLLHQIPEQEVELSPGLAITLPASNVTHTAATWAIFDVSYDLFDWLSLSVGTSTYYGQLAPDSSYQTFFFNRYTNFYFDVTIPLDALYHQIKTWSGRGSARRQTAGAASPRGGAAGQL